MKLQEIVQKFKKKSWLRLCTLHSIDKWSLISHTNSPVFPSKFLIMPGLELLTTVCYQCDTKLGIGISNDNFIAIKLCQCQNDGLNHMSVSKLKCMLTDTQVAHAFASVNLSKRAGLPNTKEFWIKKGYSTEQAIIEANLVQKNRSSKSPASKKGARGYSVRTIDYWTRRGFSIDQAITEIKKIQTTNGLKFYLEKHGEAGEELFNLRIEKWLNSPGNKNMIKGRSKKSIELFVKLGEGFYGPNEKTVRGMHKVHRVDYLLGNKIIEYYGDYWHGNPKLFNDDVMIRKKKISDVWEHDRKKIQDLIDNNYSVMIVWEQDYKNDPHLVEQQCKDFIKNEH